MNKADFKDNMYTLYAMLWLAVKQDCGRVEISTADLADFDSLKNQLEFDTETLPGHVVVHAKEVCPHYHGHYPCSDCGHMPPGGSDEHEDELADNRAGLEYDKLRDPSDG